jgi:serine/threonine protein kinase
MIIAAPQVVYTYSQGLQWCAQVADGLAFLHAQSPRIIHRDVKLDNVLLSDGAQQGLVAGSPSTTDQRTA